MDLKIDGAKKSQRPKQAPREHVFGSGGPLTHLEHRAYEVATSEIHYLRVVYVKTEPLIIQKCLLTVGTVAVTVAGA